MFTRRGGKTMLNLATRSQIQELDGKIQHIKEELTKKPDLIDKPTLERIADLEVKMAKLWMLLTEKNAYGKDKLTKFGRKFGGAAMRNNQ